MKYKHLEITDFDESNWHLYNIEPDANFSPEHNYAVIKETIDDYEKLRFGLADKVRADSEDKADILAAFAKYKLDLGGEKRIEEFLGKHRMNEIYGEELLEKIRLLKSVDTLQKQEK